MFSSSSIKVTNLERELFKSITKLRNDKTPFEIREDLYISALKHAHDFLQKKQTNLKNGFETRKEYFKDAKRYSEFAFITKPIENNPVSSITSIIEKNFLPKVQSHINSIGPVAIKLKSNKYVVVIFLAFFHPKVSIRRFLEYFPNIRTVKLPATDFKYLITLINKFRRMIKFIDFDHMPVLSENDSYKRIQFDKKPYVSQRSTELFCWLFTDPMFIDLMTEMWTGFSYSFEKDDPDHILDLHFYRNEEEYVYQIHLQLPKDDENDIKNNAVFERNMELGKSISEENSDVHNSLTEQNDELMNLINEFKTPNNLENLNKSEEHQINQQEIEQFKHDQQMKQEEQLKKQDEQLKKQKEQVKKQEEQLQSQLDQLERQEEQDDQQDKIEINNIQERDIHLQPEDIEKQYEYLNEVDEGILKQAEQIDKQQEQLIKQEEQLNKQEEQIKQEDQLNPQNEEIPIQEEQLKEQLKGQEEKLKEQEEQLKEQIEQLQNQKEQLNPEDQNTEQAEQLRHEEQELKQEAELIIQEEQRLHDEIQRIPNEEHHYLPNEEIVQLEEQINKQEEQLNKQEEQINKQEEQLNKQEEQINKQEDNDDDLDDLLNELNESLENTDNVEKDNDQQPKATDNTNNLEQPSDIAEKNIALSDDSNEQKKQKSLLDLMNDSDDAFTNSTSNESFDAIKDGIISQTTDKDKIPTGSENDLNINDGILEDEEDRIPAAVLIDENDEDKSSTVLVHHINDEGNDFKPVDNDSHIIDDGNNSFSSDEENIIDDSYSPEETLLNSSIAKLASDILTDPDNEQQITTEDKTNQEKVENTNETPEIKKSPIKTLNLRQSHKASPTLRPLKTKKTPSSSTLRTKKAIKDVPKEFNGQGNIPPTHD